MISQQVDLSALIVTNFQKIFRHSPHAKTGGRSKVLGSITRKANGLISHMKGSSS